MLYPDRCLFLGIQFELAAHTSPSCIRKKYLMWKTPKPGLEDTIFPQFSTGNGKTENIWFHVIFLYLSPRCSCLFPKWGQDSSSARLRDYQFLSYLEWWSIFWGRVWKQQADCDDSAWCQQESWWFSRQTAVSWAHISEKKKLIDRHGSFQIIFRLFMMNIYVEISVIPMKYQWISFFKHIFPPWKVNTLATSQEISQDISRFHWFLSECLTSTALMSSFFASRRASRALFAPLAAVATTLHWQRCGWRTPKYENNQCKTLSGWWFGMFFIFLYIEE